VWFLKFKGFGNYILNTASFLCPDGKWKLGPEWLFAEACKYIKDFIFKLYITMCKVHKTKEYSDVYCSVMINIQQRSSCNRPGQAQGVPDWLTHVFLSHDGWLCCERVGTWIGDKKPEDPGTRGK
jgi:hypothetical protein